MTGQQVQGCPWVVPRVYERAIVRQDACFLALGSCGGRVSPAATCGSNGRMAVGECEWLRSERKDGPGGCRLDALRVGSGLQATYTHQLARCRDPRFDVGASGHTSFTCARRLWPVGDRKWRNRHHGGAHLAFGVDRAAFDWSAPAVGDHAPRSARAEQSHQRLCY